MPEGKIKEIQGHKLQMKPSWLHESLKSEEVGFPRWRHKYIRSQTSFHAAVNQKMTTSNLHILARIWWLYSIFFLIFTKLCILLENKEKKFGVRGTLSSVFEKFEF